MSLRKACWWARERLVHDRTGCASGRSVNVSGLVTTEALQWSGNLVVEQGHHKRMKASGPTEGEARNPRNVTSREERLSRVVVTIAKIGRLEAPADVSAVARVILRWDQPGGD